VAVSTFCMTLSGRSLPGIVLWKMKAPTTNR
jgi:hypothetical protein